MTVYHVPRRPDGSVNWEQVQREVERWHPSSDYGWSASSYLREQMIAAARDEHNTVVMNTAHFGRVLRHRLA